MGVGKQGRGRREEKGKKRVGEKKGKIGEEWGGLEKGEVQRRRGRVGEDSVGLERGWHLC